MTPKNIKLANQREAVHLRALLTLKGVLQEDRKDLGILFSAAKHAVPTLATDIGWKVPALENEIARAIENLNFIDGLKVFGGGLYE
jgi:hypothetical protein